MNRLKHPIRIGLGIIFLILAVIGAFIPILQGWMFFLLALVMFFPSHPRVARLLNKMEPKWPRLVHLLRRLGIGDTESALDRYNPTDPR